MQFGSAACFEAADVSCDSDDRVGLLGASHYLAPGVVVAMRAAAVLTSVRAIS